MIPSLLLAAASSFTAGPAGASSDGGAGIPDVYRDFARDGRGARLIRIAAKGYLEAARAGDLFPVEGPGTGGRPAGPRDEPPPPEWPEGPVGLILCISVSGTIRACDGSLQAPSGDLAASAAIIAGRLAGAKGRGRKPAVRAEEIQHATLEAAFVIDFGPADPAGLKRVGRGTVVDLSTRGVRLEGSGGALVLMPGEAATLRKALRMARRARVVAPFGEPTRIETFTPTAAGAGPLRSP